MLRFKATLFLLPLLLNCVAPQARFQKHINYLASDRLEGRGVGTQGIEIAAEYIAREFQKAGLEPGGEGGTYFQRFSLTLHRKATGMSRLTLSNDAAPRTEGVDFVPLGFSSDAPFSGDVVFAGYGIVAGEKQYDDYAHIDLKGKVALIMDGEPTSWTAENSDRPTRFTLLRDKVYNAKDRGAAAILVFYGSGDDHELPRFSSDSLEDYGIPAFHVSRTIAETILAATPGANLVEVQKKLNAGQSATIAVPGVTISGQAILEKTASQTRNVLGALPGSGPLANEWIVIGAHYDHLGIRRPMMRRFKSGKLLSEDASPQIHNGADDNASGISGLIEIARMFRKSATNRSILFIAFTAEEAGLHGSKQFVDHPTVPLGSIVAMLNMDMIGRLSPALDESVAEKMPQSANSPVPNPHAVSENPHASITADNKKPVVIGLSPADGRLQVFGMDTGSGLDQLVYSNASPLGLAIAPGVDEGGRSDHAPFLRKEIPALHFFSGNHADYHQPSDDSEKINARGGVKITRLVQRIALDLANQPERPQFTLVKREKTQPAAGITRFRVVMGLTPNYTDDDVPGMLVDAVSSDGPAEIAGMKAGDRILTIQDKSISNVYDYMAATRNNQPGDKIEVVVKRGEMIHRLQVELAAAK